MSGNNGGPSVGASGGTPIIIGQVSASCPSNVDDGEMSEFNNNQPFIMNNVICKIMSLLISFEVGVVVRLYLTHSLTVIPPPPPPTHTQ